MTTTPVEPESDPDIVPSGDPSINPIDPGAVPDSPLPETQPDGDR